MKLAEHNVILRGKLETAWQKLVDWQSMPQWDTLMRSVEFDGPLRVGSTGQLVLPNGRKFTLVVTSLTPMKDYTDEFSLLGSRFIFRHELEPQSSGEIKMSFTIEGVGLLAFLVKGPLSKGFSSKLPVLMNRFKAQFESDVI